MSDLQMLIVLSIIGIGAGLDYLLTSSTKNRITNQDLENLKHLKILKSENYITNENLENMKGFKTIDFGKPITNEGIKNLSRCFV